MVSERPKASSNESPVLGTTWTAILKIRPFLVGKWIEIFLIHTLLINHFDSKDCNLKEK